MKKKRAIREKRKLNHSVADVTISDFANAEIPANKGRVRKPALSNFLRNVQPPIEDWEDLDLNEENEPTKEVKNIRRARTKSESREEETKIYSYDVWYLISQQIRPEDVGRFAGICRTCRDIVNSASFWFSLYRRNYRAVKEMPERLRPECMTRLYELKPCVIRALYYMYAPFVSKFKRMTGINAVYLVKRKCVNVWTNWQDCRWHCNILLKKENILSSRSTSRYKKISSDPLDVLNDISFNRAEGCVVLQVIFENANSVSYKNFTGVSRMLGFMLTSVEYLTDSIKMTFSSSSVSTSTCNIYTVNLNNVKTINTYYWWSPNYPYSISVTS